MGIQSHFDKFHNKIKLGRKDDAYRHARERDDSITKAVKESFKEAGYPVASDFIQGSLATDTAIIAIAGDSDVDRALVLNADDAPSNPVDPKQNALEVLEKRGFKNAKIKKPCVTADYVSENLHIDFPIYKESNEQYYLAIGKQNSDESNREWSDADPRGLIDWVKGRFVHGDSNSNKHDQYRRLVRYLKRWRDWKFSDNVVAKVYSIGLVVMVNECFSPSFNEDGLRQDMIALRQTVENILNANYFTKVADGTYRVVVRLPVKPWRDIFDGSSIDTGTQLRNKLIQLKNKLLEAENLDDEHKQCKIMNDLFGNDFVVPEPPSRPSKSNKAIYPTAGAVGTSQGA